MRWVSLVVLAGCWSGAEKTPARPAAVAAAAPTLAIDTDLPGRLVVERDGTAWQIYCDGTQLVRRPWQGGAWRSAGPCRDRDAKAGDTEEYVGVDSPIAIDRETVATVLEHEVVVTRGAREQRYALTGYVGVVALAIDGDAIVLVVRANGGLNASDTVAGTPLGQALAAIVRIEHGRATVHELVRYSSKGASVNPAFVTAGPDHLLLVAKTGNTITCDYHGQCGSVQMRGLGELYRYVPLVDGGMALLDYDHAVLRLGPTGEMVWRVSAPAIALVGVTATELWIKRRDATPSAGIPIVALALRDGRERHVTTAYTNRRDVRGRFLDLRGVAETPAGVVVRGVFGGTLTAGSATITTPTRGTSCWWENPHAGDEQFSRHDQECSDRYAKAIITERAWFRAANAMTFHARGAEPPRI